MRKRVITALAMSVLALSLTGCQKSTPKPGSIAGYDKGEQYLSIWVHSIEDTDEGRCYREAVDAFNKKYDGTYFADIEFIPRNDSGGGYSDKINASVMSGDLPDVLTVDGPNIAAYASNGIIQPFTCSLLSIRELTRTSCTLWEQWSPVLVCTIIRTY